MAEVWEARHIHLGNRVAVKFLLPHFAIDQELQERFLNEGKRQAQLQHPNIVPATDFFQVDGRSYLVMQYVEGTNLENKLQKDSPPLGLEEIHAISWDVLSALDYAHSRGVVHRDVKPSNMLVEKSGRVLLMDFGIAKALTEEQHLTRTNTSMGTPDYMSPEQITRPKEVDARSDIYSFGCVLYAMLSGSPPFSSEEATAFYIQDLHVRMVPPPLVCRTPGVPPTVGDIVLKCLEKDPSKRFQTCGSVMTALDAAISGEERKSGGDQIKDTGSGPDRELVPTKSSGSWKYVVAGAAGIALILSLVYFLRQPKNSRLETLQAKDWTHVSYNDADFSDCLNVVGCKERKAQADKLLATTDWHGLLLESPLLGDCMNYQRCMDRKAHADKLRSTKDWSHADPQLTSDCMGYKPCLQAQQTVIGRGTKRTVDPEDLPGCCKNSVHPDPATCAAIKKREGIPDCSSPLGQ